MTITFNPASQSFGSVVVGQSATMAISVSNSGSAGVAVTAPVAPFSMSPASVLVPAGGTVNVNVTFSPTSAQGFVGSIAAGGVSCQLSGSGTDADTDVTYSPKKALFINVPDFADGQFEAYNNQSHVPQITMTSFLRLGTFDYETEPPNARALLKLIHQAGPAGNPALSSNAAWAFDPNTQEFPAAPPFKPRTAPEAKTAGNRDVFFLDDVRMRDVDVAERDSTAITADQIKGHGLTRLQRQEESARLYSRGGWRDHSDGNRITTTYGDKVEVIRGNYKMIVMGRQDKPGEAMGWDVGGSNLTDFSPGMMPGAAYWHEWVPDYKFTDSGGVARTGVWLLVNTVENVYMYTRNAGTFKQEQWGDLIESYVGSENPPMSGASYLQAAPAHTNPATPPPGTQGHDVDEGMKLTGVLYDQPTGTDTNRAGPPFTYDNTDVVRSNPHIVEKKWARRIDSWTGSEALPIPVISEKKFAGEIKSDTGSASARVGEIHETTWAKQTSELVDVSQIVRSNTRAGSIFEATTAGTIFGSTTAASIQELTTAVLHTEIHAGGHISIEGGAVLDVFLGAKMEFDLALVGEYSVFDHHDLKVKKKSIALDKLNIRMRDYVLAVTSKKNTIQDEEAALKKAMRALKIDLGV